MKNILIVVPSFKILGGVANHYEGLKPYWTHNVDYIFYGKRPYLPAIITLIPDLIAFTFRCAFMKYDVIILNPSLRSYQIKRDGIYHAIANFFNKKVITFIHGWDNAYASQLLKDPQPFCKIYGKSVFIYVLYSEFKKVLDALPIRIPVLLSTTKVKDSLINGFDMKNRIGEIKTILFLARADKQKGLDVTIRTYEILKQTNPQLKLKICGVGNALEEAQQYVRLNNIQDVNFRGHITGEDVANEFSEADIYILPTHGEGMATSILEAMAFGLPIISRPVGGINDFFEEGRMGYLIESFAPVDYAIKIQSLIDNIEQTKKISHYNHHYAVEHFLASKVANRFENDINVYL